MAQSLIGRQNEVVVMEDDTNRGFSVVYCVSNCNNISNYSEIIVMTLICKELRWMKSTRPNALQIEM